MSRKTSPRQISLVGDKHQFTLGGLEVEVIALAGLKPMTRSLFGCRSIKFVSLAIYLAVRLVIFPICLPFAVTAIVTRWLLPMPLKLCKSLSETIMYGHHAPIYGKALIS